MTTGDDDDDARPSLSPSSSDSDSDDSERELGRHDYWESTYERELATLAETGDEGEVWFGEKVEEAVAAFCAKLLLSGEASDSDPGASAPPPRLLDVGCGNGALLLALANKGFTDLTGSDYSEGALALAKAVVERRKQKQVQEEEGSDGSSSHPLSRASFSLIHDDATDSKIPPGSFDAATDKGTLDAVGLSAGGAAARRLYLLGVARCLKGNGGLLIVTSVNSTLEELRAEVEGLREEGGEEGERTEAEEAATEAEAAAGPAGNRGDRGSETAEEGSSLPLFDYLDHVRTYPVYSFGGRTGARVATVAFRKR